MNPLQGRACLGDRVDAHQFSAFGHLELDYAGSNCVKRIIRAARNVCTWMDFGAALSHQNIAWQNHFASVAFDAQALWLAVSAVACRTGAFFMCHLNKLPKLQELEGETFTDRRVLIEGTNRNAFCR
jgi:hypothetical protein